MTATCNQPATDPSLGHANIAITMDRYGHLMPGNERQAADLLDEYLRGGAASIA